jgi:hypothetical protein
MNPEEDTAQGFHRTSRTAHDNRRGPILENALLRGDDVVANEAASRPHAPASVQAAVKDAHMRAEGARGIEQPTHSALAERNLAS